MSATSVAVGARAAAKERGAAVGSRFLAGDPLRGFAAMTIVVFHLFAFTGARPDTVESFGVAFEPLAGLDAGVWVFFVLSGYLLSRPFIASVVERRPLPHLRRYVVNRLLRILPAFWVVYTVILVLDRGGGAPLADIAAVYGFAQTWVDGGASREFRQGWTINAELIYYLALPIAGAAFAALARRLDERRARIGLLAVAAAAVLVGSVALRVIVPEDLKWLRLFPTLAFAFVPGVVLALVEVAARGRPVLPGGRFIAVALLGGAVLAFAAYAASPFESAVVRPVLGVAAAALLVAAPLVWQWSTGAAWWALDNPLTRYLGTRSYSIYLVHFAIAANLGTLIARGNSAVEGFLLALPVLLAGTLAAAELSYRLIERPFQQRKLPWRRPAPGPLDQKPV